MTWPACVKHRLLTLVAVRQKCRCLPAGGCGSGSDANSSGSRRAMRDVSESRTQIICGRCEQNGTVRPDPYATVRLLRTLTDRPARCFANVGNCLRPASDSRKYYDRKPVRYIVEQYGYAVPYVTLATRPGSFQQSIAAALSRSVYFAPGGDDSSRGIFGLFVYEAGRNEPSMDFIRSTRARGLSGSTFSPTGSWR